MVLSHRSLPARCRSPRRGIDVRGARPSAHSVIAGLTVLATAVQLMGCAPDPRHTETRAVVATVGTEAIERKPFLAELTWTGVARNEGDPVRHQAAEAVLDRMIEMKLLALGAEADGIQILEEDIEREVLRAQQGYTRGAFTRVMRGEQMTDASYRARLKARMMAENYLTAKLSAQVHTDEATLRKLYDTHVAPKPLEPRIRVRQILVETKEEAEHLRREIVEGRVSMTEAARRYSQSPDGTDGGVLPWFSRGELPLVFDRCFDYKMGDLSPVVSSDFGYHLFRVLETKARGPESWEDARPRLELRLRRELERDGVSRLLDDLKKRYPVKKDKVALGQAVALLPPPPKEELPPKEGARVEGLQ